MSPDQAPEPDARAMPARAPGDIEERLHDIAERYLDDLRAGRAPDRNALAAAHPEIAAHLRRRLAVVEMLHNAARKN